MTIPSSQWLDTTWSFYSRRLHSINLLSWGDGDHTINGRYGHNREIQPNICRQEMSLLPRHWVLRPLMRQEPVIDAMEYLRGFPVGNCTQRDNSRLFIPKIEPWMFACKVWVISFIPCPLVALPLRLSQLLRSLRFLPLQANCSFRVPCVISKTRECWYKVKSWVHVTGSELNPGR